MLLEIEYWGWLQEIATKTGAKFKDIIEAMAATKNPKQSLASEIRIAVAAYFHRKPLTRSTDAMVAWFRDVMEAFICLGSAPGGKSCLRHRLQANSAVSARA